MNRLKLLATATLMALTFTACDEGTPPPVEPPEPPAAVGTISGTVTIEGTAASGITATLSSGATTTTGSGGSFAFSGVEEGTYTVTISGFPEDATFAQVTQSATIATDGQNVQLNFAGEYIRSSAVVGNVVAADAMMSGGDGQPETLEGVTVTLDGEHAMADPEQTAEDGGFAFTGLRAGTYTVTISDFPEDVSFETLSLEIEVEVGEVGQADFTGHFIRTSAVEGQVIIEGEGLAGVTVTLSGGPADENFTRMTDADGMYRFEELRPGDYMVSISDFDTRDYEFASTSADVSVDLDETGTVDFTGVLLRTSGIAGRVSVEGMGLPDITVTLGGGDEPATRMTDASGQYSFAGLAAGDYTVSISVESAAYVFESMSSDVTLGDDESAIVNFEGAHARTASVSGMAFIDEATKNDMFDEGEHPLARAGIPVALVGPGVNQQQLRATDETGAFSFTELQAGHYQLVVLLDATVGAALAASDLAYGGSATGYEIEVDVGEAATQSIPFDITHTTVNFTVSLKHGDDTGAALPGAHVDVYSDAAGETRVGHGDSDENGMAAIKVARAVTSGNMVYLRARADGYHAAEGLTAVSWDPQMFATAGANDTDIVNLNVDASVSGATVTTDYGGGDALKGWAISVTSGDDAVEGAPAALDDEGNAAFKTTVGADDLPATFTVALADDQANTLDGGENYSAQAVEYTHTGLSLAGTADAGTLEVAFTTQTLKVYAHHERDQVMGYTGNVLDGDVRDDGKVSVSLRYIDDSGRSRTFAPADSVGSSSKGGVTTFTNVPADRNVIVQASVSDALDIELLEPDELAAYTGTEANGITGGHFGAHGGYSHTVSLCPLQDTNPQDHGECSSFAYVSTFNVSGLVWKKGVVRSGDGFKENTPTFVPGQTVSLSPVDGKNLAGKDQSYTTAEKDTRTDKTKGVDATHVFDFGQIASGAYKLSVPAGWRARTPAEGETATMGATGMLGNALNPLGADLSIDVTPATATVYGRVNGSDGFPLDSVTVTVNGRTGMTDALGRYIIDGVSAVRGQVFISAAAAGQQASKADSTSVAFAANSVTPHDIDLRAVQQRASISGTVRAHGTNAPVAGVEIKVDGAAPLNKAASGANAGKLVTGADGTYTAEFAAKPLGQTATVSVSKRGMSFVPAEIGNLPAHAGSNISGIDFTGFLHATITGRVVAPGGGPLAGVALSATSTTAGGPVAHDTTGVTGSFSLSVPHGGYTVAADLAGHIFEAPSAVTGWNVNTAPGQTVNFGSIQAKSAGAMNVRASRERAEDVDGTEADESEQRWGTTIAVMYDSEAGDVPEGYDEATYVIQTNTGAEGAWADATATQVTDDDGAVPGSFTIPTPDAANGGDGEFKVRVVATAQHPTDATANPNITIESEEVTIAAIDPSATGVAARRQAAADSEEADSTGNFIQASWTAVTNDNSDFRVVVQVTPASLGGSNTVWLVLVGDAATDIAATDRTASREIADTFSQTLNVALPGGDGSDVTVTAADLNKAISVAVESRQGAISDDNQWTRSAAVSVAAKPSS